MVRVAAEQLTAMGALAPGASGETLVAMAWLIAVEGAWARIFFRPSTRDLFEQSLELLARPKAANLDTRVIETFLCLELAWYYWLFEGGDPRQPLERALTLSQSVGDRHAVSSVLIVLGWYDNATGDYEAARRELTQSLALGQALGNRLLVAMGNSFLAVVSRNEGEFGEAEWLALGAVATSRDLGNQRATADTLEGLVNTHLYAGKYADASARAEEWVAVLDELDVRPWRHNAIGHIEMHLGHCESARAQAVTLIKIGSDSPGNPLPEYGRCLLGYLAVREGAFEEALRLATADTEARRGAFQEERQVEDDRLLAYAELGLGNFEEARHYFVEGLRWLTQRRRPFWMLIEELPVAALFLLKQGKTERAVEIYALACTFGHVANSEWYDDVVGLPIAVAAAALSPEVVTAARERGRARDVQATLEELLEEWED
jgi:tetratricopeptide (TPR) repeat protein